MTSSFKGWGSSFNGWAIATKVVRRGGWTGYTTYQPGPVPLDTRLIPTVLQTELNKIATQLQRSNWVELIPTGGWSSLGTPYASPAAMLLPNGLVLLRGVLTGGTLGTVALALNYVFQPMHSIRCTCASASGYVGVIEIDPSGDLTILGGSTSFIALDGISYPLQ